MAELSTVARPYAEALMSAAIDQKASLSSWGEQVQRLADVSNVELVRVAMSDPRLNHAQRAEIFLSLVKPDVDVQMKNLVNLLVANDRLSLLEIISSQFHALKDAAEGVAQAHIYSAFPMSDEQVSQLIKLLEPKFGIKLKPVVTIDTSLIGGVRVQVGDHVLDTSVQAQLVSMRDALAA